MIVSVEKQQCTVFVHMLPVNCEQYEMLTVGHRKLFGELMLPAAKYISLGLHVKYPIILSGFNQILSLTDFHKAPDISLRER
jgi:hypothetical protein